MGCFADPPHIEDSGQPAELLLTPGTPLELRCDAQGTPLPNITWHKDGQALSGPADSSRVLRVEDVQVQLSHCCGLGLAEGRGGEGRGREEEGRTPQHLAVRLSSSFEWGSPTWANALESSQPGQGQG